MLQDVEARRHDGDRLSERRYRPLRARARGADAAERSDLGTRERGGAVVAAVSEPTYTGLPQDEIERRYRLVREAAARDGLDAVLVCGNEYTGFEGAVTYLSGFVIVHRYAYVLLPVDGDPAIVFPSEARYVGEHGTSWIDEQVFVDRPGEWIADRRARQARRRLRARLRDDRARLRARSATRASSSPGTSRSTTRAWSSRELELASVRDSVRINTEGFWVFLEHFEPGKTRARGAGAVRGVLRRAGLRPLDDGHGARRAERRARCPSSRSPARASFEATDCVLPSLEVAGPGGHWVEVSRAICPRRAERRHEAHARGVRGVLRGGARRAPAGAHRARRAPRGRRRASSTAASISATSPATRSG